MHSSKYLFILSIYFVQTIPSVCCCFEYLAIIIGVLSVPICVSSFLHCSDSKYEKLYSQHIWCLNPLKAIWGYNFILNIVWPKPVQSIP